MKNFIVLFICLTCLITVNAQETDNEDYIEFNDRTNVVHGVYLGLSSHYGSLNKEPSYGFGFKIAYVANQQFEVGLAVTGFQSDQQFITSTTIDNKLTGGYIGAHLEPILFSKRKVSLGFPLVIGVGALGYINDGEDFEEDFIDDQFDELNIIVVVEPGVSALFNLSRYLQLEAGIKYRFSSKIDLPNSSVNNLNGFSAGIGLKIGVFNMGRNRYKKKVKD